MSADNSGFNRLALRRRLIAARGRTYTYKDPDAVASRIGGVIGDDGTIDITVQPQVPIRPSIFTKK